MSLSADKEDTSPEAAANPEFRSDTPKNSAMPSGSSNNEETADEDSTPGIYIARTRTDDDALDEGLTLRVHDTAALEPPIVNEPTDDTSSLAAKRRSCFRYLRDELPSLRPYWLIDYLDYKSFRIVFRTWLKAWVCALMTVIGKSDRWFGNASYLLLIYSFVVPCGTFSIMQSIIFGTICVAFACWGWSFSIVAMAINSKIRGNHGVEFYAEILVKEGTCSAADPVALQNCVLVQFFHGRFLETRTTVITVITLFIGTTLFLYIKQRYRMFIFGGVVGIISLWVTGLYGNYLPYFDAQIFGLIVIKPMGVTFALNVIASALIFPKTSNFAFFEGQRSMLKVMQTLAKLQGSILKNDRPSRDDFARYKKVAPAVAGLKGKLALQALDFSTLKIESSYGRLDKEMADRFSTLVVHLLNQLQGFEIVYEYLHNCRDLILCQGTYRERTSKDGVNLTGAYEQQQQEWFKETARGHVTIQELDALLDAMDSVFAVAFELADDTFEAIIDWVDTANHFRVYTLLPGQKKKHIAKQKACEEKLRAAQAKMMEEAVRIHQGDLVKKALMESLKTDTILPALIGQGCLFGFLVRQYVVSLNRLSELLLLNDEQRPLPSILHPWSKTITLPADPDAHNPIETTSIRRDPDSMGPQNKLQKFGARISRWHHAFGDKMFLVAVKTAIGTILISVPAFCRTTAWWHYSNRLVWVSIMTGLSTFTYLGDTLYVFICDAWYTLVACVAALVGWYMGNGHGTGNPYGMAIVYAVFFIPFTFYRHFSIHYLPIPAIFICVTFCLVIGTSWQDTHVPQPANIGTGWEPSWKRFVTVMVGLTVGVIANILPKPFTVKKAIRVNLGQILTQIGTVHCDIGTFAINRARDADTHVLLNGRDVILQKLRNIQFMLGDTRRKYQTVRFEPPLSGKFPKARYLKLLKLQSDIVMLYGYLYAIFNQVDDPSHRIYKMVREYGWTDTGLNSDFLAVLHMCGGSLVMRWPLPMLTPAQTTVRHMEILQQRLDKELEQGTNQSVMGRVRKDTAQFDFSTDGRLAIAGHCLVECIYEKVDGIAMITKELVGEEYDVDEYYFRKTFKETMSESSMDGYESRHLLQKEQV